MLHSALAPTNVDQYRGSNLKTHVQNRIATWGAPLQALVELTDPSTISTVPLRSMPQLPDWAPSNITLLGDAIHNMTPMVGIGANTALRDADELRRALINGSAPMAQEVATYETAMREYGNCALALSTRNAGNAALATKGNCTAFRTLLRIGRRVRPMKRKMF